MRPERDFMDCGNESVSPQNSGRNSSETAD